MSKNFQNTNSDFLLNILLEGDKHLNIVDFMDKQYGLFACVAISFALAEKYQEIQTCFTNAELFAEKYFIIYADALEKFRKITNDQNRQIFVDEALITFPLKLTTNVIKNLSSNTDNKKNAQNLFNLIKNKHNYVLILRDDIMSIIIHHADNEYIIIDPHVEYSGIATDNQILRYVTYDGIWDYDVHIFVPEESFTINTTNDNSITNTNDNLNASSINISNDLIITSSSIDISNDSSSIDSSSSNTESSNTESSNTESSNTESSNTESSNTESSNTESSNTESSNIDDN